MIFWLHRMLLFCLTPSLPGKTPCISREKNWNLNTCYLNCCNLSTLHSKFIKRGSVFLKHFTTRKYKKTKKFQIWLVSSLKIADREPEYSSCFEKSAQEKYFSKINQSIPWNHVNVIYLYILTSGKKSTATPFFNSASVLLNFFMNWVSFKCCLGVA